MLDPPAHPFPLLYHRHVTYTDEYRHTEVQPLRTSPNSRKHRTSSSVLRNPAVHVLSSSSSTGSPWNTALTSNIANVTFRTLHSSQLAHLAASLHVSYSTRSLRLSNTNLLSTPFVLTAFGSRFFSVAALKIWNSLTPSLCTCTSPDTFRRQLKTHYCRQAFQST